MNRLLPLLTKLSAPLTRQPSRSTWVFKRRHPTNPSDPNSNYYAPLNRLNFIYEIVNWDKGVTDHELKVILTTYIKGLGDVGDIVSVKADIARKSLLLPKKAVYASPENVAYYETLKKNRQQIRTFSTPYVVQTITNLTSSFFPLMLNNVQSWKVEPWHVRMALEQKGYELDGDITLPSEPITGPDPDKTGSAFVAHIKINDAETAPLICVLFQWGHDMPPEWEHQVGRAALPELQEQLDAALQHRLDTIAATEREEEERRINCLPF